MGVRTLLELANKYVATRKAAGFVNPRSAEQIRYRLWDFADHAPTDPLKVRPRHVEAWMMRPDLAPQYLRARLSALRGFCRWCVARGYMKQDPTLEVPMPKVVESPPKRMTHDEAVALTCAAGHDIRTALVVSLMLQEAMRRIEVARANVEDIDFAERTLLVRGKGGRGLGTDVIPLSEETWGLLRRYLADEGNPSHGPLIRNRVRNNKRMAASSISDLVRDAMYRAGVKNGPSDKSRTPHSARHTAAHEILALTGNVRDVQKGLRHRSLRTTELAYLRGEVVDLRRVLGGRSYIAHTPPPVDPE